MWICEKCGGTRFSTVKECCCVQFTVIDEDGDDYKVYAMDKEDAALKFAEKSNSECDYYLMNESVVIEVEGVKFEISAEPDIQYSAFEID